MTSIAVLRADRIVYLGADNAIDDVVAAWANRLGVRDPLPQRISAQLGGPLDISRELQKEYMREQLRRIRWLGGPNNRSIELMADRIVLLSDDKTGLSQDDLLPATLIVFGLGNALIRRVGPRLFACPGSPDSANEGVVLVEEDKSARLSVSLRDTSGRLVSQDAIEPALTAKLRVQGES
jgi:hypothetical protein